MQDTLVGKKFGNLVVQKLAYRGKDSKKYWECQCGCGRVCLVQESHLKNGHTKSCGCLRKKRMTNRWLDLTGQRYGRLVVLRLANQDEISAYGTGKEGELGKNAEENAGGWADCRICGFAGVTAEMYVSVRRKISGTERQRAAAVSAMKPDRKICARQFTLWTEPAWSASRAERPASTTPAVTAVYIGDPTEPGGPASDFREKSTILGPSLRLMRRCRRGCRRRKSCMIRLSEAFRHRKRRLQAMKFLHVP